MSTRNRQIRLLDGQPKAYGGELRKTRKGREGARPLATRETMHLVLRSSKARGDLSFKKPANERQIRRILTNFGGKYGVKILSLANVGNHLHLQIKLGHRRMWNPFIRAVTAAIAMAVAGTSRWNKADGRFWDYRPFTRVVRSRTGFLRLRDYIAVNRLEGDGNPRPVARWIVKQGFSSSA